MVLLILGLLMGGFLGPLSVRQEVNKRQEAEVLLQDIHDTLMGFAMTHGHLPCPDADGDGREDWKGTGCGVSVGELPHVTLGIGRLDPWNNRLTYAVDPLFADRGRSPLPSFASGDQGNLMVIHGIDHTPAVVVSHGSNGLGAVNMANLPQGAAESASERENSNHDPRFVLDDYREVPDNGFDDLMIWISPHLLAMRMMQAGKPLP